MDYYISLSVVPLTGALPLTGLTFASPPKSVSYVPGYVTLGFVFFESFPFLLFFVAGFIYIL